MLGSTKPPGSPKGATSRPQTPRTSSSSNPQPTPNPVQGSSPKGTAKTPARRGSSRGTGLKALEHPLIVGLIGSAVTVVVALFSFLLWGYVDLSNRLTRLEAKGFTEEQLKQVVRALQNEPLQFNEVLTLNEDLTVKGDIRSKQAFTQNLVMVDRADTPIFDMIQARDRLIDLEAQLPAKASKSNVMSLQTAVEGKASKLSVTRLETAVEGKASSSSVAVLSGDVTSLSGRIGSLTSKVAEKASEEKFRNALCFKEVSKDYNGGNNRVVFKHDVGLPQSVSLWVHGNGPVTENKEVQRIYLGSYSIDTTGGTAKGFSIATSGANRLIFTSQSSIEISTDRLHVRSNGVLRTIPDGRKLFLTVYYRC